MSEPGLIDLLVGEDYRDCYRIASELYTDEQARQACCATLMIQYTQLRKSNVKLAEALKMLEKARMEVSSGGQTVVIEDGKVPLRVVKACLEPLMRVYPKASKLMSSMGDEQFRVDFDETISKVVEYMARNGLDYRFECVLSARDDDSPTNGDGTNDVPTDD